MSSQSLVRNTVWSALVLLCLAPATTAAQQTPPTRPASTDTAGARRAVEQKLGRRVSQAQIIEHLRESKLSQAQIRTRLQQAGYDPGLADRYFDMMNREEPPTGDAPQPFLDALKRIGIVVRDTTIDTTEEPDSLDEITERERLIAEADSIRKLSNEVFGVRTFRNAGTQFKPALVGPVDPGYRLGPGDELMLVLTGDVEAAHPLDVTREGLIFVPDVGEISVNGLTLAQLQDVLYSRLGRVYSGVSRSASATTRFHVSIGRLRTNQVYVRGDVAIPGAVQVSTSGSVFTALYQAGGPLPTGSFRRIEIHRGGEIAHTVDLYDFLVGGRIAQDVRLENNDHIFVPPAGIHVRTVGAIRRPATYELLPGEGLKDLIRFAGGLRADALSRRLQIDRVLPPAEQRPGQYRTVIDVDFADLSGTDRDTVMSDGDVVHVLGVPALHRNLVTVTGAVRNPGVFEWQQGATMWSLLRKADGLSESAYTARAHVYRLNEHDGSRSLYQVSLERDDTGRPLSDITLVDHDSVVVLSRQELRTEEMVTIDGMIKRPEKYVLAHGMTLKDLILTAGGFVDGASLLSAEVSRLPDPRTRSDTTAVVKLVSLDPPVPNGDNGSSKIIPNWTPEAEEFQLRNGDHVFIRRAPGYEAARYVKITGEVLFPGAYMLATRGERFTDIVARAGGVTSEAFAPGMHVVRDERIVAADLQRALRRPDDRHNILLSDGDSIHVPALDPTVVVTGAVNFEARVLFEPGKGMDHYIRQAGGYTVEADRRQVTITYPNGERNGIRPKFVGVSAPRVQPGSHIFVPEKPEGVSGTNWDQIITRAAAVLSATATLLVIVQQSK